MWPVCQAERNYIRPPRLRRCFGALLFLILTFSAIAQPADNEPKDATEWFQRANDQMDLRAPGRDPLLAES
jgi:hypothetical protein